MTIGRFVDKGADHSFVVVAGTHITTQPRILRYFVLTHACVRRQWSPTLEKRVGRTDART